MGATLTDVYIVVFSLIGILITYPGLAAALNLLMPDVTNHAYRRLMHSPFWTFVVGALVTGFFGFWILVLIQVKAGLVKAIAGLLLLGGLGLHALGSAALSRLIGERLATSPASSTLLKNVVKGAVIYELACFTPVVGWFLFLPLATFSIMGASVFGLIRWSPRQVKTTSPDSDAEVSVFDEDIQSAWAANL